MFVFFLIENFELSILHWKWTAFHFISSEILNLSIEAILRKIWFQAKNACGCLFLFLFFVVDMIIMFANIVINASAWQNPKHSFICLRIKKYPTSILLTNKSTKSANLFQLQILGKFYNLTDKYNWFDCDLIAIERETTNCSQNIKYTQ